jgi:hypothetical protein
MMAEEPELIKELVIGYLITKSNLTQDNLSDVEFIHSKPITTGNSVDYSIWALDNEIKLDPDVSIIGLIPAPFPTYEIRSIAPNGQVFVLGYEHPTLKPQDWKETYEHAMQCNAWYGISKK